MKKTSIWTVVGWVATGVGLLCTIATTICETHKTEELITKTVKEEVKQLNQK